MDYHIANNKLRVTRIQEIRTISPTVKTFTFKDNQTARAEPGQFLMLWIPGVDEIPLSVLTARKNGMVSVAVKEVGEATAALHRKERGELIGVRGPFGNSFTLHKGKILMVSGGTGTVPILFLARKLASQKRKVTSVIGGKTREELLFINKMQNILSQPGMKVTATTEDGSYGVEGLATDRVRTLLEKENFDVIYTCGPEQMMRTVFNWAEERGILVEASLERLMRCAIGLCGSCTVGRYRVCRDGPVFTSEQLREISSEFGVSKRGLNGRKIPLT